MSLEADPIAGRPMSVYFFRDPANVFTLRGRMPSSNYIKTTVIPQLQNMREPSPELCYMFSSVLSLLHCPKELHCLDSTLLLTECLCCLRWWTGDTGSPANKLFSYEYGFLCFRVIVLLMHVGILESTDTFDVFSNLVDNLSDPHIISAVLSEFVMQLKRESLRKPEPRHWLLNTRVEGLTQYGRMFLPYVGGFWDKDVDFFVEALWNDRQCFTEICFRVPTPGWGLPLILIGEHLRWAAEEGVKNPTSWSYLDALCYRYSLVAPIEELESLGLICWLVFNRNKKLGIKFNPALAVDPNEARAILQAYLARMTIPGLFPPKFALMFLNFVKQDSILSVVDLAPSLIKTSCLWMWEELDASTRTPSQHPSEIEDLLARAEHTFDIITFQYYQHLPVETLSTLTTALAESDFVNLFLRILLLPLTAGSNISKLGKGNFKTFDEMSEREDPRHTARSWSELAKKIFFFSTMYPRSCKPLDDILRPLYYDWSKTRCCFQAGFPQHLTQIPSLQNYIDSCHSSFIGLGSSLGYVKRERETTIECAYPRCPGTTFEQLVCEECLVRGQVTPYCSHLCQTKHWSTTIGEAHRENCTAIREAITEDAS